MIKNETCRPALDVWVTGNCSACERTLRVLTACAEIQALVNVRVHLLGEPGETPPAAVVGGPATVFRGTVLALGTPNCSELARRIMGLLSSTDDGGNGQ